MSQSNADIVAQQTLTIASTFRPILTKPITLLGSILKSTARVSIRFHLSLCSLLWPLSLNRFPDEYSKSWDAMLIINTHIHECNTIKVTYLKLRKFLLLVGNLAKDWNISSKIIFLCCSYWANTVVVKRIADNCSSLTFSTKKGDIATLETWRQNMRNSEYHICIAYSISSPEVQKCQWEVEFPAAPPTTSSNWSFCCTSKQLLDSWYLCSELVFA